MARLSDNRDYPDDIFKETRMSFGEHIEELRARMIRGLVGLMFFLILGFILDAIGNAVDNPNIGIGRPMLQVITDPVESQVKDFYNRRIERAASQKLAVLTGSTPEEVDRIRAKLKKNDDSYSALTHEEREILLGSPQEMPVILPAEAFTKVFGQLKEGAPKEIATTIQVYPAHINYLSVKGEGLLGAKKYLSTLSVQEGFVIYFKVSIVCGIVLSSPWLLYQFWAFVGAGLYPHEKRYIAIFFWPSMGLFLAGVFLCQFVVLPGAVKALLTFNDFLDFDPDIRVKEWFGLAIILPLVFGISFQTPVVMVFLNRIGVFSADDYARKWRYACFILAFLSAILTPTPDVVTMMYLFVPMFGLYLAGIVFCHFFPADPLQSLEEAQAEQEIAV